MDSPNLGQPARGYWLHQKSGKVYYVLATGRLEREGQAGELLVVYGRVDATDGTVWIRPLKEWCEPVALPDGKLGPRFVPHKMTLTGGTVSVSE